MDEKLRTVCGKIAIAVNPEELQEAMDEVHNLFLEATREQKALSFSVLLCQGGNIYIKAEITQVRTDTVLVSYRNYQGNIVWGEYRKDQLDTKNGILTA